MMKTLALVAAVVAVLVAGVLGFAATRANEFRVQRSARIEAPPEKVFAAIQDFHRWQEWSPWEKLDTEMRRTYAGPASGRGAMYYWQGNRKAGAGRMQIAAATPPTQLRVQLDFKEPFVSHNLVEFTLVPVGSATDVTWSMHGSSPFLAKLMGVFVDMDRMIGKDFEQGLANLKATAEKTGAKPTAAAS